LKSSILVTGGAGYVGSHTCKALHNAGYIPISVDNLVNGHRSAVNWGPLEVCDICDVIGIKHIFLKYDISAVIHFAAFAYVGESIKNPLYYYNNNVVGTLKLLEAMAQNNCNKIIFSSSCATYGIPSELPITEKEVQKPISPYGRSKLFVEQILKDCQIPSGIKHVNLRYFNAAGADTEQEIGENHNPETHLIPLAIQTALGIKPVLEICGTDFDTPDGTAMRDYVHVSDLAEAHVLALEYLQNDNTSDSFNLGSGKEYSVLDIVRTVEQVSGRKVIIRNIQRRNGDPPRLVASFEKAKSILNWSPRYNNIETIVSTAWDWQKNNL
jgi:UDP-arabinose 4-epimerase